MDKISNINKGGIFVIFYLIAKDIINAFGYKKELFVKKSRIVLL